MSDVLIVGDTERSPELRHEIPLHVGDPFLYAEVGGRRVAVVWSIEGDRISVVDPTIEIVCDLFPRHAESACFSDLTRTFSVGEPDTEIASWHAQSVEALELARDMVRAGVDGTEVFRAVCAFFEERGHPTSLSKPEGAVLREGFNHGLGHGVGLDVHEAPSLGKAGHELAAGDVITLEPGLYRHGFGGVRVEDLLVVTDDGCETITTYPYDLSPDAADVR